MLDADSDMKEDEEINLQVILKQDEKSSLSMFSPTLKTLDPKITNLLCCLPREHCL